MIRTTRPIITLTILLAAVTLLHACSTQGGSARTPVIPAEYASKHMPAGWWADESIVREGRALYLGLKNRDVNCAKCHGRNGKPVKSGARNFRDTASMKRYSDSHLLWRLAEGVPYTQMRGYKGKLSEEQLWKIVAFVRTFGLAGLRYDVASKQWVPLNGNEPGGATRPDQERA